MGEFQRRIANLAERYMPKFFVDMSRDALVYAGLDMDVGTWMLFSVTNSLLLGIIFALLVNGFVPLSQAGIAVFAMFLAVIIVGILHNVLLYYGKRRAIQIEKMMPDSLQLIAANIRADIPIHKAILLAARPEFGLMARELGILGDDILAGKPTDVAFREFSKRIRSPLVTRISTLMEEGLRSGHDLAGMLEQVAYDIREFRVLEEEANANIGSYVIFIMMAVIVIAPVLYSISIAFVDLSDQVKSTMNVQELVGQAAMSGGSSTLVGLVAGDRGISADTLVLFAALNLAASAAIAAILISVLKTGEALQKLPYVPAFVVVAEVLFFVSIAVLRTVLGGFFA